MKLNIFIAEDLEEYQKGLKEFLPSCFQPLIFHENKKDAIKAIKNNNHELFILDIHLPLNDESDTIDTHAGVEIIQNILKKYYGALFVPNIEVPIIGFTNYGNTFLNLFDDIQKEYDKYKFWRTHITNKDIIPFPKNNYKNLYEALEQVVKNRIYYLASINELSSIKNALKNINQNSDYKKIKLDITINDNKFSNLYEFMFPPIITEDGSSYFTVQKYTDLIDKLFQYTYPKLGQYRGNDGMGRVSKLYYDWIERDKNAGSPQLKEINKMAEETIKDILSGNACIKKRHELRYKNLDDLIDNNRPLLSMDDLKNFIIRKVILGFDRVCTINNISQYTRQQFMEFWQLDYSNIQERSQFGWWTGLGFYRTGILKIDSKLPENCFKDENDWLSCIDEDWINNLS